ncbi:MAG: ABC-F family ATP-binding cassette domain-containing protein [Actinomycetota bacterium]
MIIISGLRRSFGARALFDGADLRVGARDRIAIVGPNGSGKTTLFEMISGHQEPDGGSINLLNGAVLGYLAQETDALRGRTVLEEVMSAGTAMRDAGHRLQILTAELEATPDEEERGPLLEEYAHLTERFEALGGWSLETEARQILAGLGFSDADTSRRTETLSGGWLMRVALAKLLLAGPDVLLLDEPTNHLDLESVVWLERFLRTYEGALMLISHDRDFMNGIVTRVGEIESSKLVVYTGDYASFVEQREMRALQAEAAAKNIARKRAQSEVFINRFRYKASKARQVQSRIKALDRMDAAPVVAAAGRTMKIGFPPAPRAGRIVMELRSVGFSYGDHEVYRDLNVSIERGQKVALVGPNGAGKTTLLKLIAGALKPTTGECAPGANVAIGYFAQHQVESLDPSLRVLEELERSLPPGSKVRPRDLLGRFLFPRDDVDKPVGVLSGGERSRLALAKVLASPFNLLCMDEPTNHLDIASRDVLEDALQEYDGTMVLITHDRHLIRSVADHVIEVTAGRVRSFPGDYERYLERVSAEQSTPAPSERAARAGNTSKEQRRSDAEERQRQSRARTAVRSVETKLEAAHAQMESTGARLADPEFYAAGQGVAELVREYERLRAHIAELETEWDRLTTELG